MDAHQGGCLCGAVRYEAAAPPLRVTICHCRFCQRATGTAYFVEPMFRDSDIRLVAGTPKTYEHRSTGSGKIVTVHFCDTCGTKVYLTLERFEGLVGVYGGTFDEPGWFERTPGNARHIFVDKGLAGTMIPAGYKTFHAHALDADDRPLPPVIHDHPFTIGDNDPESG